MALRDEYADWRRWASGDLATGGEGPGAETEAERGTRAGGARLAVLLTGVSGVGKDTLAAELVAAHGFVRLAIGDLLKDVCHAIGEALWHTRLDRAQFDDPVRKNAPATAIGTPGGGPTSMTPNDLCFAVGTGVLRRFLGEDVWVRALLRTRLRDAERVVFTDVRFPSDLAVLRAELDARGYRCVFARLVPPPEEDRPALEADALVHALPAELEIVSSRRAGPAELCARAVPVLLGRLSAPAPAPAPAPAAPRGP